MNSFERVWHDTRYTGTKLRIYEPSQCHRRYSCRREQSAAGRRSEVAEGLEDIANREQDEEYVIYLSRELVLLDLKRLGENICLQK